MRSTCKKNNNKAVVAQHGSLVMELSIHPFLVRV